MKLLSLFCMLACGCLAQDVRVVDGRSVDLQPIHDWYAKPNGERPMKHWRQVQVSEYKGDVAGMSKVLVDIDGSGSREVLLKHLDSSMLNTYKELAGIDAEIASLEGHTQASLMGGNSQVARNMNRMAEAGAAQNQQRLSELKRSRGPVAARVQKAGQTKLLARWTGTKYAGLEVWDCGSK